MVAGKSTGISQRAGYYKMLATEPSLQNGYKNKIYFNTHLFKPILHYERTINLGVKKFLRTILTWINMEQINHTSVKQMA
jgi:hypothetical protein